MYDDLYPEAAQTALDAKAARPPEPKQTPRFSLWGTTAAVPKGVAAGAAQATGSTADILGAFGSVLGTEGSAGGMFSLPTPEEEKQQREATEKLRANGPDYMSEGGRSFRNVAKDYTPDPLTTHAAERIVFDFSRVASKSVTAAITMGGVPGAIVTGLEEGFTVSDQLAQEGVDPVTRTKVGVVTAVTNAVSFALPVAGGTVAKTTALALTGGPLSFMTQNAATRKILQDADYSKLADQYDPFDPLGLALSTVIPLGFGAMAMRGAAKRAAGQKIRESDATETIATPEAVDAARTSLLRESVDNSNPLPKDLAAAQPHADAHAKAIDQMASGERVNVADVLPENVAMKATEDMAGRLDPIRAEMAPAIELFHGTKDLSLTLESLSKTSDIGVHFTTAKSTAELFASSDGTAGQVISGRAKFNNPIDLPDLNSWFPTDLAKAIDDVKKIGPGPDGQTPLQAKVWAEMERAKNEFLDAQPKAYQALRTEFGKLSAELEKLKRDTGDKAAEVGRQAGYEVLRSALKSDGVDAIRYKNMNEGAPVDTYIALDKSAVKPAKAESAPTATPKEPAAKPADGEKPASYHEKEATRLALENPDVMVMVEGMDAPKPLSEVMAMIKKDLADDIEDSNLIQVAAECSISTGAGGM